MTLTIHDIIELLSIVKLYVDSKLASRVYVKKTFHEKPIKHANLPNYTLTERMCETLGLIAIKSDRVSLTDLGGKTLEWYEANQLKFPDFFIKNVLFGTLIGQEMYNSLSKFNIENNHKLWCQKQQIHALFTIPDILPILYEINLLEKRDDAVEINPKYTQLIWHRRKITQKQLEVQLEIQKRIGAIAEEIVMIFERDRLVNAGYIEQYLKTEQVSSKEANAGYDIESSYKDAAGNTYKIYIEVKGSTGTELNFYISANELEKAKEYGKKYWIYFVPDIDIETRSSSKEIITIQDPYERIFNNSEYTISIEKYHIIKKSMIICGNVLDRTPPE